MTMEKFHWTSPTGVEIVIPRLAQIKAGVIRKYRKQDEMDMVFSILEDSVDPEELEKIDDLDHSDLEDFITKWQAGSPVGESSRSSS